MQMWSAKKGCIVILLIILSLSFLANCAQTKGTEKAISYKIERWEAKNYHLTEYRKQLIMRECLADFENSDEIINRLGFEQKNFDRCK